MNLKVKKLHADAKIPSKGHPGDAGIDFFVIETAVFAPGAQVNVKTGVAVEIEEGHRRSLGYYKG